MITVIFYILSAITLASGVLTVLSRNPINSAVYMIICLFSVSGHFLMLNAQFLAVVNIIVYAGAIMVLLLFTLMLMNLDKTHEPVKKMGTRVAAAVSSCLAAIVILAVLIKAGSAIDTYKAEGADFQSVRVIGQVLLDEYLLPFEFASVLLITSMIGAVMVSKRDKKEKEL